MEEIIHHLAVFVSRLWQIHIFGEENTRATAVFLIKYLRTLGFSATNDIFAKNAWYFRNALVGKLYEPAKGYPRNKSRVFGGILEELAEVIHKKGWLK